MSVIEFSFLSQLNIGLGLFQLLLLIGSVFLILLILVQRGKGGGLTGALGGMGGQSAFGAKAGDAFTKVTVVTSLIWITLCMVTIALFNKPPPKTVKTTKSPIDIAREIENGASADSIEMALTLKRQQAQTLEWVLQLALVLKPKLKQALVLKSKLKRVPDQTLRLT